MEPASTSVEAIAEKVPTTLSKAELVNLMMDVVDSMMSECQKQEISFQLMSTAAQARWSATNGVDRHSCGVVYKKMRESVNV
jgi:hypothetical protein